MILVGLGLDGWPGSTQLLFESYEFVNNLAIVHLNHMIDGLILVISLVFISLSPVSYDFNGVRTTRVAHFHVVTYRIIRICE